MILCLRFFFPPRSRPVPSQSPAHGQRGVRQRWEAQSGRAESPPDQRRSRGGGGGSEAHRRGRLDPARREEPAGH